MNAKILHYKNIRTYCDIYDMTGTLFSNYIIFRPDIKSRKTANYGKKIILRYL